MIVQLMSKAVAHAAAQADSHPVAGVAIKSAASYSGKGLKDYVLGLLGTFVGVIIAGRGFGHYAKNEKGEMIGAIALGVAIGGFCWFPDETVSFLKFLWHKFMGS